MLIDQPPRAFFMVEPRSAGVGAMFRINQELLPSIDFPSVYIVTAEQGASPEVVDRDVSVPLANALQGMPGASDIIGEIAADIARTTDSHLDVLSITHEHWDHLSGFAQARDVFSRFKIDELWLAWTEDEKDPDAARIRARRRRTLALLLTLDRHFGPDLASEEDPDADEVTPRAAQRDDVRELLAFTGEAPLGAAASHWLALR